MKAFLVSLRAILSTFLLTLVLSARAQTSNVSPCYENFDISTQITPSLCQSDGTIAITITGEHDNYHNFSYTLQSTVAGGYSSGATSNSTLTGIPAGRYTLIIAAFCKTDQQIRVTKSYEVEVPGNYKTIKLSYDQERSIASVADCATGRIALNVSEGNGNYRFRFVKAPTGVPVGQEVFPVQNDGGVYTLDNYPSGEYRIEVYDNCYIASIDFTLPNFTTLPTFRYEDYQIFRIYHYFQPKISYDCGTLRYYLDTSQATRSNLELSKAIRAGFFEVGLAPTGEEPKCWETLKLDTYAECDMSPLKASNFYEKNALEMTIRFKSCPTSFRKFSLNVSKPSISLGWGPAGDCVNKRFTVTPPNSSYSYSGLWCYPLDVAVYKLDDKNKPMGAPIATAVLNNTQEKAEFLLPYNSGRYEFTVTDKDKTYTYSRSEGTTERIDIVSSLHCDGYNLGVGWRDFSSCRPAILEVREAGKDSPVATVRITERENPSTPLLEYGKQYTYTLRQEGTGRILKEGKYAQSPRNNLDFYSTTHVCGGYTKEVRLHYSFAECLPAIIEILEEGNDTPVGTLHYTTNTYQRTPPLKYDKKHIYRVRRDANSPIIHQETTSKVKAPKIKPYSISRYDSDKCREHWGKLKIYRSPTPPNTVYKIKGPEGFIPQEISKKSNDSYVYSKFTFTPPGEYTITIINECDSLTYTYDHPGFWQKENFTYAAKLVCGGLLVSPSVNLTYAKQKRDAFFYIKSGPDGGYSKGAVYPEGSSFTLTVEGTYELALTTENRYNSCAIASLIIEYKRPALKLSQAETAAYVCNTNDLNGNIFVKAENGVEPYTYEIYDEHNQHKIDIPHKQAPNGAWHYIHGRANEVYTVRIEDACGNRFAQQVTVLDLKLAILAAARRSVVCAGEDISLLSLPFDSYKWFAPDGSLVSTEQYPIIRNAKPSQSGIYTLRVNSEKCNADFESSIRITVLPCYAPVNPQLMNRTTPRP